jgi:CubicO group peptidase (beta-lactamase class C family)/uncharacterized Tic20 family protein
METPSIAKNLVYQRKLKGYTQEELSEKTQVTIRTIQRIEKGDVTPHLQTVKLLAAALEVEVDDLLVLQDPKEENIQIKWLLLFHGTPILGLILPLCNILLPLFLWIHKREDSKIYDVHGRKVINFQISMTLFYLLSFVALLTIEQWGFFFFIAVVPFGISVSLYNIVKVMNGGKIYYPLAIPFIKGPKGRWHLSVFLPLAGCLLFLGSCSTDTGGFVERLDGSTLQKDSLTIKIKRLMNKGKVQGMAITIFNDNKVAYQEHFGFQDYVKNLPLTDSTNIYGGSFSKAVFGVLVMKLVENGQLDLDTPLESYLPKKMYEYESHTRWHDDLSALKNDSLYHKITARMCLAHTTGFANYRWFEPDYQLRVHGLPGERYSYSGEGFIYLQLVLERMLGKDLETLAQQLIFRPLQMDRSSYRWLSRFEENYAYGYDIHGKAHPKDTDNEPRGGSTLETTSADYTKFLLAVLEKKILSENSWNTLFRPHVRIRSIKQFGPLALRDSTLNDPIKLGYGLGWGILQTPYGFGAFKECHGDGFQHYSILFPEAKKGILIMTNSDNGEGIFKELLELAIGDTYTPWEWENYIPYDALDPGI